MTALMGGFRFQLWRMRSTFDDVQSFVIAPMFAIIFVGLVDSAGHPSVIAQAALGAALISLWTICVQVGGAIIDGERGNGTLEPLAATSASITAVVSGRLSAVILTALLVIPEVWLTVAVLFGRPIAVPHPGVFIASLLLIAVGLHGAASLLSGLFVLARTGLVFQNALTYPFFILGGLLVPVAVLPGWLQPLTRVVFLSWGSDLLRSSLSPASTGELATHFIGLAITSAAVIIAGQLMLGIVVNRARTRGTLSLV